MTTSPDRPIGFVYQQNRNFFPVVARVQTNGALRLQTIWPQAPSAEDAIQILANLDGLAKVYIEPVEQERPQWLPTFAQLETAELNALFV